MYADVQGSAALDLFGKGVCTLVYPLLYLMCYGSSTHACLILVLFGVNWLGSVLLPLIEPLDTYDLILSSIAFYN